MFFLPDPSFAEAESLEEQLQLRGLDYPKLRFECRYVSFYTLTQHSIPAQRLIDAFLNPFLHPLIAKRHGVPIVTALRISDSGQITGHLELRISLARFTKLLKNESASWRDMFPFQPPPKKCCVVFALRRKLGGNIAYKVKFEEMEKGVTIGAVFGKLAKDTDDVVDWGREEEGQIKESRKGYVSLDWTFHEPEYEDC
jgi:hypothetical protein